MRVTPLEIRKQEFKKSMRGYDPVEVDTFLEKLADDFDTLTSENSALSKKIIAADAELKHFKEVEKTLKETLYNVQQTSQLSKQNSEKEATLVKKEAELVANQMLDKARQSLHAMREEVNALKRQKESFSARLRHLLSSQLELLEVLELDDEQIADIKDKTKKTFSGAAKPEPTPPDKPVDEEAPPEVKKEETKPKPNPEPGSDQDTGQEFFDDIFKDEK